MSKKMMVNATHPEENRVAIVEDGVLTELDIEVAGREPTKGNIYKAVVVRVEAGLQAAFVDYGAERMGFLQIDEINFSVVNPDYKPAEEGRRPRINDLLHRGQEILVQITKEERGTKGAALTTYLSLAGRYMVLMPGSQTRGVSRKAESDAQRKELKKAMSSLDLAEGIGYIVRTAALDQTREELERDYRYLIRLYESIKKLEEKSKAPALIYKESNLIIRSIRDYFTTDMDEVLIDDPLVYQEARDFFAMVMPDHVKLVKQHQERRPIFSRYQIEDQIETLSRNKVTLPSGGSIVIDTTEALVAIDVNSGKMASEQGVEATATKTNLEAATEVGRQLRLRDLGGLIVIDFIDMRERKHMRQVENQLKKSLEHDKARVNVGRISQFGLLEMSRQRIKAALTEGSYLTCPHCNGTGQLKSPEAQAVALLRKIHASAAKGQVSRVDAQLPMDVATYLLNNKREELVEMERRYQLQIHIHGNRDFVADQIEIEIQKKEKDKTPQQEFVAAVTLPPADEVAPKEEVAPADKETAEGEAEPNKKRRRRRRRKSSTANGEAAQAPQEQTSEVAETVEGQEPDTAPGQSVEPTTVKSPEESTEEKVASKRPRRRRRSTAKDKATQEPATTEDTLVTVAEKTDAPDGSAKEAVVPKTAAEPTAAPEGAPAATEEAKPKPRRRSARKPKPAEGGKIEEAAATPEVVEPPKDEKKTEDKPKAKRPRRTAKKPVQQEAMVSAENNDAPATPSTPNVEEVPAAKKPTRRARPRKAAAQAETNTADKPSLEDAQPAKAQEEKPQEDKPKRRRTSRAKPKAAADDEQKSTGKEGQPAEAPAAAEASATRSTPRKAPAKKATETDKTEQSATETAATSTGEDKPKPKRRRTAKKKPAEEAPATEQ